MHGIVRPGRKIKYARCEVRGARWDYIRGGRGEAGDHGNGDIWDERGEGREEIMAHS